MYRVRLEVGSNYKYFHYKDYTDVETMISCLVDGTDCLRVEIERLELEDKDE